MITGHLPTLLIQSSGTIKASISSNPTTCVVGIGRLAKFDNNRLTIAAAITSIMIARSNPDFSKAILPPICT
jgi:hypothetical protein